MKKRFWLLILALFMLVTQINPTLKAKTYNPINEYTIAESGARVKDSSGNEAWWQNGLGKIKVDGEVAFCIEPTTLGLGGTYSKTEDIDFDTVTDLSRIVYLGWDTSAKTDKDYATTQYMIWEALGSTITYWYGSFGNEYPQLKAKIQAKLDKFDKKPAFDIPSKYLNEKGNIQLKYGESIVLTDKNNVLSDFNVVQKDGASYKIKGNKLTITVTEKAGSKIEFKMQRVLNKNVGASIAYRSSADDGQDVAVFKVKDPVISGLNIDVEQKGKLQIIKTDDAGKPVANAKFKLFKTSDKSDTQSIATLTTDAEGYAVSKDINAGTYYIEEIEVGPNYKLDSSRKKVTVVAGTTTNKPVTNKRRKLTLGKKDTNGNWISNTTFELFSNAACTKSLGEFTTGENGKVSIIDKWGFSTYYIQETSVPKNLILDKKVYPVSFKENQDDSWSLTNDFRKLIIQKISHEGKPIRNTIFKVATDSKMNNLIGDGYYTTNNQGEIEIPDVLGIDYYYIQEVSVPSQYIPNTTVKRVKLSKNKDTEFEVVNEGTHILIQKVDEDDTPVNGVTFKIASDPEMQNVVGEYTTMDNGAVKAYLTPRTDYYIQEIKVPEGLQLDSTVVKVDASQFEKNSTYTYKMMNKFTEEPLKIVKRDALGNRVQGVKFRIARNSDMTDVIGDFITNENGVIIQDLVAGTYYVQEIETLPTLILDSTIHEAKITNTKGKTLSLTNQPTSVTVKKVDPAGNAVEGCTFLITKDSLTDVVGEYTTDENGMIHLEYLTPGIYYVKETAAPSQFLIDETIHEVKLEANDTAEITIMNKWSTTDIFKVDEEGNIVPNTQFELYLDEFKENLLGVFITDEEGKFSISGLESGIYYLLEVAVNGNLQLNPELQQVVVEDNKDTYYEVINEFTWIKVIKKDEFGNNLSGVTFYLSDKDDMSEIIDVEVTDENGELKFKKLMGGTYYIQEVAAPENIVIDNTIHEIVLEDNKTAEISLVNTYKRSSLKIIKYAIDPYLGEAIWTLPNVEFIIARNDDMTDIVGTYVTDSAGQIKIENLELGTYYIQETKAADGFQLDSEIKKVEVDEFGKEFVFEITNRMTETKFSKIDATTNKELPGATIHIIDPVTNNVIEGWISTDEPHVVYGLIKGKKYIMRETIAPKGYAIAEEIEFIAGHNKKVVMKDELTEMTFSKTDFATGKELPGATIQIIDKENDEIVDEWISSKEPHIIKGLIEGKEYIMRETIAPKGYDIAEEIEFIAGHNEKITMKDEITEMVFSKVDITTGKELEGATIQIIDKETNKMIEEWISTKEPHIIKGLIEGKKYIMRETIAPKGYAIAEEIVFTAGHNKKITMKDEVTEMIFSKIDFATGEELEGATIQIIDKETNKVIEEWISSKEPHIIKGLVENKEYIMREIQAPFGYLIAEEIEFKAAHGTKIEMKDKLKDENTPEDEDTPETDKEKGPGTGDDTNLAMLFTLFGASIIGLMMLVSKKKKVK